MPPKKSEPSKKSADKQKQKVIEDKTFGLKNKKGAKQQRFIQQVQKQVTHGNKSAKDLEQAQKEKLDKKEDKKREILELNELFKPVAELQKCAKGVDPKSILCVYHKQGLCTKGNKCKFSHDLTIERKAEKRGIYDEIKADTMDDWDQAKLEEVISKKHEATNKGLPQTAIICKYFLDAVEASKYGWFWECPNGDKCHYRHALPGGFVLKKDQKKLDEQKETISLDDLIEKERQALGLHQTKVTFKSFMEWKKRRRQAKVQEGRDAKAKREADFKLGRATGVSGREVFEFNPNLVIESMDEEGGGGDVYDSRMRDSDPDDEYTGPMREIDVNTFELDEEQVDDEELTSNAPKKTITNPYAFDMPGAVGGIKLNGAVGGVAIDEELFNQSDLEDLENELEILDVSE